MWAALMIWFIIWLWQYRPAMLLEYRSGTLLRVYLLPRVCGGYAKPIILPISSWWKRYLRQRRHPHKKAVFRMRHLHIDWRFLLRQTRVEELAMYCCLGSGDPMSTSLCCGAAQMLAGLWFSGISQLFGSVPPCPPLVVQPDFGGRGFRLCQCCIISVSVGDISIAIAKSLRLSLAKRMAMAGKETSYVR